MCGRFAWYNKSTEIIDAFKTVDLNIEKNPIADIPSYNIAPCQRIIVIESESKTSLKFKQMKWGLEPPKIKHGSDETFTAPPLLGQHSREILIEVLGYDTARAEALLEEGAVAGLTLDT